MSDVPDRCTDFDYCPSCGGLIEAGGDNFCTCPDTDEYGDWLYHQRKDEEHE